MQGDMYGGNGIDLGCFLFFGYWGDGGGGYGQGNDDFEVFYLKGFDGSSLNQLVFGLVYLLSFLRFGCICMGIYQSSFIV